MSAMTLNTRMAAARRRLKRIQEDRPLFLKRIKDLTPEQKALAIAIFDKSLNDAEKELGNLLAKHSPADQKTL